MTAGAGAVTADTLKADADRLLAAFAHRWVVVDREPLWRDLEDGFLAAGWGQQTHLFMLHRRRPDRIAGLEAVREVDHDEIRAAELRYLESEPWCTSPEPARQVLQHHLRIGRALGERCFAAYDGDDWPKELYGRLGFEPMGRTRMFHRLPST